MKRNTARTLFALAGVLLFAACTDNNSTGISGDASGTYNLATVNNAPPPVITFQDPTTTETLTGGNFTLNTDGSFSQTLAFDETVSGQTTSNSSTCTGTFSQSGGTIFFSEVTNGDPNCGGNYNGSWDGGDTLGLSLGSQFVLLFSKAGTP
ncbi:MAG: hypothetical protein ACRENK_05660 [Gemmatimonadaceae bacterium]